MPIRLDPRPRLCLLYVDLIACFQFIDESGHDRVASLYEVLAGIAIRDRARPEFITRLHEVEVTAPGFPLREVCHPA